MEKRILVGSQRFFKGLEGFEPNDIDYVILGVPSFKDDSSVHTAISCEFRFSWKSADEFVSFTKKRRDGLAVCKFFVPEFMEAIGANLDHLKELCPLLDMLKPKHSYYKVIYEAYITNGDFFLTPEQRNRAYQEYLKYH